MSRLSPLRTVSSLIGSRKARGQLARRVAIESLESRVMLSGGRAAHLGAQVLAISASGRDPVTAPRISVSRAGLASAGRVPGEPGQSVLATFHLVRREARFHNEVGLFLVDD